MTTEHDDMLFSQLADGELPSDQVNDLLQNVLDDPAGRDRLKQMLRLRQATARWRLQQPSRPMPVPPLPSARWRVRLLSQHAMSMVAASIIGGVLVLAGFWAAGWMGQAQGPAGPAVARDAAQRAAEVTPEQMRQVAKVFALHESVAGPLAWYAADDQNIRLGAAQETEAAHSPVAVLLKLVPASPAGAARTFVIVCREDESAAIELPSGSAGMQDLRVYLTPRTVNGKIRIRYAIAADDSQQAPPASLSGRRNVGLTETPLGQLAVNDGLVNIAASAWPVRQEPSQ